MSERKLYERSHGILSLVSGLSDYAVILYVVHMGSACCTKWYNCITNVLGRGLVREGEVHSHRQSTALLTITTVTLIHPKILEDKEESLRHL